MKRQVAIVGWVFAAIAAVVAAVLAVQSGSARKREAELKSQLEVQHAQLDQTQARADAELKESQKEAEDLRKQVAELEGKLAKAGADKPAEGESASPADLLKQMLSASPGGTKGPGSSEGEGNANPLGALAKMFEGEAGEKMADYTASMTVNMSYQDLFKEWNLPKETEDRVREILEGNAAKQMKASLGMMKTGFSKENADKMEKEGKAQLREELAKVLTPEELAQWEEYEGTMEERMLGKSYEMQMSMMAPGLTPESREIVKNILVEETQAGGNRATGITDVQQSFDAQTEAFVRAAARLADGGQLDEAQLSEAEKFLNTMKQQMEMARAMFGGMTQNAPAGQGQPTPAESPKPEGAQQGQ